MVGRAFAFHSLFRVGSSLPRGSTPSWPIPLRDFPSRFPVSIAMASRFGIFFRFSDFLVG